MIENENDLRQERAAESDYYAGALMRQILESLKENRKVEITKRKIAVDYCDVVMIIYPNNKNNKGGLWYLSFKDTVEDENPGIRQGQNGYSYDFYDIPAFISHFRNNFIQSLLTEVSKGERPYDFIVGDMSYHNNEDIHNQNREAIKKYIEENEEYKGIKEIRM